MSEKLYKLERAIEFFDDESFIPERFLVFMGPDGPFKLDFPENRTTLFFRGELYDWYGHKVALSDNIVKVLEPFGYYGRSSCSPQEKFLVVTKDHRYALATLCHKRRSDMNNNTPSEFMHSLLHYDYASIPFLKCLDWSFREFKSLESTCFHDHFMHADEYTVFLDVKGKECVHKNHPSFAEYLKPSRSDFDFSSIWFTRGNTHDDLLKHLVFGSREIALSIPSYYLTEITPRANFAEANYLLGDLQISKHGEKITALFPIPDEKGNNRISTDAEIIKHCAKYHDRLPWYYDPSS